MQQIAWVIEAFLPLYVVSVGDNLLKMAAVHSGVFTYCKEKTTGFTTSSPNLKRILFIFTAYFRHEAAARSSKGARSAILVRYYLFADYPIGSGIA